MVIETKEKFVAQEEHSGCRLDSTLAEHLNISRNRVAKLIGDGEVLDSKGKALKASLKLEPGEIVFYSVPSPQIDTTQSALPEQYRAQYSFRG